MGGMHCSVTAVVHLSDTIQRKDKLLVNKVSLYIEKTLHIY